jgi:hypothetical protein
MVSTCASHSLHFEADLHALASASYILERNSFDNLRWPQCMNADGQETQGGVATGYGGDRQGRKPPSPWRGPGYGH